MEKAKMSALASGLAMSQDIGPAMCQDIGLLVMLRAAGQSSGTSGTATR